MYAAPLLCGFLIWTDDPQVLVVPHHLCHGIDVCHHASRRLDDPPDDARHGGARRAGLHLSVGDGNVDACRIELDLHRAVRMEPGRASRDTRLVW